MMKAKLGKPVGVGKTSRIYIWNGKTEQEKAGRRVSPRVGGEKKCSMATAGAGGGRAGRRIKGCVLVHADPKLLPEHL